MDLGRKPSLSPPQAPTSANFNLLRARIENDAGRPAIIAITSSSPEDGKDIAALGLADSLSSTGYRTIYIDMAPATSVITKPGASLEFEEMARQILSSPDTGHLSVLTLRDPNLQERTSQRNVTAALETLSRRFDYIVINTESGDSSSLGASVIASASAVLVTVKKGRRQKPADARLAASLKKLGVHFLGVLAIGSSITINETTDLVVSPIPSPELRHGQSLHVEQTAYLGGK